MRRVSVARGRRTLIGRKGADERRLVLVAVRDDRTTVRCPAYRWADTRRPPSPRPGILIPARHQARPFATVFPLVPHVGGRRAARATNEGRIGVSQLAGFTGVPREVWREAREEVRHMRDATKLILRETLRTRL